MYSWATRLNAIFAFSLSCMAAMTFAAFCTTVLNDFSAPVRIQAQNVQVKNVQNYAAEGAREDIGLLDFDLEVDFSKVFNWNVKQLFLYLVADYSTAKNPVNEVVLWDKILKREGKQVISIRGVNPKYYFWDDGTGLKNNKNVTLQLRWNVIPNAGYLHLAHGQGSTVITFPDHYKMASV